MTYNTNTPRGDLLPVDERPRFQNNFTHIQTELRDDHFWNEDSNLDGHHRRMALPNIADTAIALTGSDPTSVPTSATGQFYVRPKDSTEAANAAARNPQPHFQQVISGTEHVMQLGFRALGKVTLDGAATPLITNNAAGDPWDYEHNVSNVTLASTTFTITFRQALPSTDYLVFASSSGNPNTRAYRVGTKTVGSVTLNFGNVSNMTGMDFMVIGG